MNELIAELLEINSDNGIPKNVRLKISDAILALQQEDKEDSIKANKALQKLDEISDDPNMPSYTRTQIWNVVSQLESI
tara:strand:- start:1151 stop:1384 length:234 start_codon:yes stop_codon:yes gene_type:complete